MSTLSKQILQTLEVLSEDDQRQILDFVEFLRAKRQKVTPIPLAPTQHSESAPQSFLEVAQAAIGAGVGPGDLSTNPDYMQGYGQ